MDDPNHYIRRTIELETEVRLLKEQLAQAHGGTQYLLNCVAQQQQVQSQATHSANTERQIRELKAENSLLKQRLRLQDSLAGHGHRAITYETPVHSRKLALREQSDVETSLDDNADKVDSGHCSVDDDLLSFDDAECSPSPAASLSPGDTDVSGTFTGSSMPASPYGTPLTPTTPGKPKQNEFSKANRASPVGLGISNLPVRESARAQEPQRALRESRFDINESFATVESENEKLVTEDSKYNIAPFTEDATKDDGPWQAIRAPPPPAPPALIFGSRFADGEHNQLAGYACFIEDMSEEEQDEYWRRRGRDGRHSAEDWRKYYEEVVRPTYLAKVKQREGAVAGASSAKLTAKEGQDEVDGGVDSSLVAAAVNGSDPAEQGIYASRWAPQPAEGRPDSHDDSTAVPSRGELSQSSSPPSSTPDTTKARSSTNENGTFPKESSSVDILDGNSNVQALAPEQVTEDTLVHDVLPSGVPAPLVLEDLPPLPDTLSAAEKSLLPKRSFEPSRAPAQLIRTPPTGPSPQWTTPRRIDSPLFPAYEPVLFFQFGSPHTWLYHTVCISNIPVMVSLAEVLAQVRGGKIVTATYHSTAGMNTVPPMTGNTVIVLFLGSRKAMEFVDFCQSHPLRLPARDEGQITTARVTLIQTPTRPLPSQLLYDMRERNLSRVLFILDAEHRWMPEDAIQAMLKHIPSIKRPIAAGRDEDGILYFEFADVRDAADAWNAVEEATWFFVGASKGFWPDPCDLRKLGDGSAETGDVETQSNQKNDESMASFASESTMVDMPLATAQTSFAKTEEDGKGSGV
jgi:hypothetical protein